MKIAGIDYSITSPAICIYDNSRPFCFENCEFRFLTSKKKYAKQIAPNIQGELFKDFETNTQRFDDISQWAIETLRGVNEAALEGYAFSAQGLIFNLAENCGLLKYKLFKENIPLIVYEPGKIKKVGAGKGNSCKDIMYEAFVEQTKTELLKIFDQKTLSNPVTDIVDSYFIVKTYNLLGRTSSTASA